MVTSGGKNFLSKHYIPLTKSQQPEIKSWLRGAMYSHLLPVPYCDLKRKEMSSKMKSGVILLSSRSVFFVTPLSTSAVL